MSRFIIFVLLLVTMLLPGAHPAFAQEETGEGRITVDVTMETAGETLPDELEAELLFLPNGQGPPIITREPVGPEGTVEFDGLDTAPEHRYLARVSVDEHEYFSQLIAFSPDETVRTASVTVYATTDDVSALSISHANVIAEAREDRWIVATLYVVTNSGDRLVVPPSDEGVFLPIPSEATDLSFQDTSLQEQSETLANGIRLTTQFPPGQNRIVFSYVLPYQPPSQTLDIPLAGPLDQAAVLIADLGQQTTVPALTAGDPVEADSGQPYLAFQGNGLPADTTISVAMTGLPAETPAGGSSESARTAAPVGLAERLPWWTPLVVMVVTLGAVALYLVVRPAPTEAERRAARRQRREELLDRIVELDDRHEAGAIGEQTYKRQRASARRELKRLLRHDEPTKQHAD